MSKTHISTCTHVKAWYVFLQLTVCTYEKELREGKEKRASWRGWVGASGWEIRYGEVGGIWVEMEISPSLVFLSPLPSRVSLYLPPWECSGAGPASAPGGPLRSPSLELGWRGLHAMHYLEVNGFVLAGPAAVNGHHYSFITAGTGWNESCIKRPEEPLQLLDSQEGERRRDGDREREGGGEKGKWSLIGREKDVFSGVTSGENQLCERLSVFNLWRNSQTWRRSVLQNTFKDSNLHLAQLWPTYPTFFYPNVWRKMTEKVQPEPGHLPAHRGCWVSLNYFIY